MSDQDRESYGEQDWHGYDQSMYPHPEHYSYDFNGYDKCCEPCCHPGKQICCTEIKHKPYCFYHCLCAQIRIPPHCCVKKVCTEILDTCWHHCHMVIWYKIIVYYIDCCGKPQMYCQVCRDCCPKASKCCHKPYVQIIGKPYVDICRCCLKVKTPVLVMC